MTQPESMGEKIPEDVKRVDLSTDIHDLNH
jgi:hypothetical protein